ncbi:MAG TPA: outer membrane protein assembly factor BamA [Edaphobacter sp.]|nr:outer membrane protein assembly factor BamA [Edaphobacter sp.]
MRIFTVNRESGSSLKCKAKPVCTRSSRSRIAHAAFVFAIVMVAASTLPAQVASTSSASVSSQGVETLCQPQVIGNRRIPKESVLARLFSRQNDLYDPQVVERDFNSLWNTGYFEDIQIERVDTPKCVQLVIYVREKPTIREINYKGLNAVTLSDVLDRYKKAKVPVSVESQYDPTKIARAVVVLKDLLAEHGHQFATVTPEIKKIPPASVSITFNIKEGPTVKVGKIAFQGNTSLSDRTLRSAMKNLKPIGIPHSIILENLFARTFDASKLDEDTERVRQAYRDRGYFHAQTSEPTTHVRDAGGLNPFTLHPSNGKRIDILMPVEEGERYKLGGITFSGNKNAPNTRALRAQFAQKDGEYFNATMFSKGLDQLRKSYGSLGYINMVANPVPRIDEAKKLIYLDIDIDEGKPYYVARIEFTGNTITRDKVIRRELLLEEGAIYNSQLWELSILRLNQLNYFETLKADQDSESRQNSDDGTVDLLLKLKEKGKNSIGLNGGISGLSGTFIGLNYETNNFLGLGETLSVQANIGDLSRTISFGFTEPYLRDKPISVGAQVFATKYDFNPSKSQSTTGATGNLSAAQQSLLTNYNTSTTGLTLTASEPLRHLFAKTGVTRLGLAYSLSRSTVTTFNQNTTNVFQSLAFRSGVAGQNQLTGIITSVVTPSFTFSSLDRPVGPHHGKDFNVGVQIAGVGGNVKYVAPIASYRQFFPMKGLKVNREGHNVLGYRLQLANITGFGGEVAPPTHRFYSGGEQDLRGFDTRSVGPYVFIPNKVEFTLTNPDGTSVPLNPANPALGNVVIPLPIYRMVSIGGDTQFTANLEYRIPIVNQVTFAFFTDFGMNMDLEPGQLRQSTAGQSLISGASYGCPTLVNGACFGGSSVKFPDLLAIVPGTNYQPRMSNGAELQVILPIVNAPFRIYYAYNSLRLYEDVPQKLAVPNSGPDNVNTFKGYFPTSGAGQFSYAQALQFYGADYILREPRKTFRLTVSTTF